MVVLLFSEEEMSENPLKNLYRSKSVYVSLPSKGKYYKSGLELSIDEELGVMPMTAVDEIKLKSPDALFNGDALFDLIRSCVPDIQDPREIPACDTDIIMMAIKIATHGDKLDVTAKCPSCEAETDYEIPLSNMIASSKPIEEDDVVEINDKVRVYVRPYSLSSQIKGNIQKFHQMRMQLILNNDMSAEDKANLFNEALLQASTISVSLAASNILKVEITDDEDNTTEVTDENYIMEWVENMDSVTYERVIGRIRTLSDPRVDTGVTLTCSECSHEYNTKVELDPVNFFT